MKVTFQLKSRRPASSYEKRAAPVFHASKLLQSFDSCAEVDVIRLSFEHEGWNGCYSCPFSFGDAVYLLSEMHDFYLELLRIESRGDAMFGGDAHRTSGMIEYGFCFHYVGLFGYAPLHCDTSPASLRSPYEERGRNSVAGHHIVPVGDGCQLC